LIAERPDHLIDQGQQIDLHPVLLGGHRLAPALHDRQHPVVHLRVELHPDPLELVALHHLDHGVVGLGAQLAGDRAGHERGPRRQHALDPLLHVKHLEQLGRRVLGDRGRDLRILRQRRDRGHPAVRAEHRGRGPDPDDARHQSERRDHDKDGGGHPAQREQRELPLAAVLEAGLQGGDLIAESGDLGVVQLDRARSHAPTLADRTGAALHPSRVNALFLLPG